MNNLFLAEERKRLGYKSKEIAEYTGVTVSTQSNYENGRRRPDTRYLYKIAKLGFDLNYVVTGQRSQNRFSELEINLIELFSSTPKEIQNFIISGLKSTNPEIRPNIYKGCKRLPTVLEASRENPKQKISNHDN